MGFRTKHASLHWNPTFICLRLHLMYCLLGASRLLQTTISIELAYPWPNRRNIWMNRIYVLTLLVTLSSFVP